MIQCYISVREKCELFSIGCDAFEQQELQLNSYCAVCLELRAVTRLLHEPLSWYFTVEFSDNV